MVWIILAAVAVGVIALVALAWWSSGRAKPITRHSTQTETLTTPMSPYNGPNIGGSG
ncbi:MAG: hypothetical protein ACRDP2_09365 [Nocardioidaceae bacterium]